MHDTSQVAPTAGAGHLTVTRPRLVVPAGACDCHCHVFGPYRRYPLAADRTYTPPEAGPASYIRMLDTLGFARGVLVQSSAHGLDNSALLHALAVAKDRLRGVAVVDSDTPFALLEKLHSQGIRGLRFSRLLDAKGQPRYRNAVDINALDDLLPSMRKLGMHAQLWMGCKDLAALAPPIRRAGIPFVIDHLGRPDAALGIDYVGFRTMRELVADGHLWVKLTPYRPSSKYPDYDDMRPFHKALLECGEDRLVWGSDWPHINMQENVPDAGRLADLLADWTSDGTILRKILVLNPARLYDFP